MGKNDSVTLKGASIFILGTTKFDNPYESASYIIAKNLAKNNLVFYIENPYTWKDYIKHRRGKDIRRRRGFFSPSSDGIISTEITNLKIIITPPLLSINFLPEGKIYRLLLKINEHIIANRIKKILRRERIQSYIYINSFNFHYPNVADHLHPILKVYHCVDPLILPFDRRHGIVSEQMLVQKSDVLICTSRQLFNEKRLINKNTHFIPNAADITHSGKALAESLPIHGSIANLKKPVVGYLGNIERRLDFNLIKEVSQKNPNISFVFAGPMSEEFIPEWFHQTPNIYKTGRFNYEELPAMLKGFDAALIPFKRDGVSNTIFPLKLFEYLGAGKPVISTDFNPDLEEFTKGSVRYCSDSDSFSKALNEELDTNSREKVSNRLNIAAENTWEKRVEVFSRVLASGLKQN